MAIGKPAGCTTPINFQGDPLLRDLIRTLVEAGFSKHEAKAEVLALVKWARQA